LSSLSRTHLTNQISSVHQRPVLSKPSPHITQLPLSFEMYPALGFTAVLTVISFLGLASAQCYSPNACLDGWIWRQANPTDHVCVTPAVRSQTAADNAAASSRHEPNSDSCIPEFVWREAYTNDVVCVTPATRTEAALDNAAAAYRVASLNIWTHSTSGQLTGSLANSMHTSLMATTSMWRLFELPFSTAKGA
jgi:hypothetical protein